MRIDHEDTFCTDVRYCAIHIRKIRVSIHKVPTNKSFETRLNAKATVCQDVLLKIKFNGQTNLEATFIQM